MITIISQDNKIYRMCIQLGQKKYRDRLGLYIVEGEKMVREAIQSGQAKTVVMRDDFKGTFDRENATFVFMTGSLFSKIAQTETSQGIMGIIEIPHFDKTNFLKAISAKNAKVLVLDRLQDPGNIGTIIRTADAAGYAGMIVMKGSGDIFSPKVIRAASGSLMRMPFFKAESEDEALSILSEANKAIIGTTPEKGVAYNKTDWTGGIALLIGNEGNGLSETFKAATIRNVTIPMSKDVDSLNAAVAAGILIYESIKER